MDKNTLKDFEDDPAVKAWLDGERFVDDSGDVVLESAA
jgi:hypothetical protein